MSRVAAKNFLRKVNNPYPTESQSYTAWEKGFIEGFDSSQANPCFEENDLIDFAEWLNNISNTQNKECFDFEGTHVTIKSSRELLNIWKQSKSN